MMRRVLATYGLLVGLSCGGGLGLTLVAADARSGAAAADELGGVTANTAEPAENAAAQPGASRELRAPDESRAAALPQVSRAEQPALRELEAGLVYVRATQGTAQQAPLALPAEWSHAEAASIVLDLRYVGGAAQEAAQLGAWLRARADAAAAATIFLILINAQTAPELRAAAAQFAQARAALLIGPVGLEPAPDIALVIEPAAEREAYAVLVTGGADASVDLAKLVERSPAAHKPRYDEAAVIAARRAPATPPPLRESTQGSAEAGAAPPVDLSLQRAIHLHRAWRALKLHP